MYTFKEGNEVQKKKKIGWQNVCEICTHRLQTYEKNEYSNTYLSTYYNSWMMFDELLLVIE